jgi:hypothetical protein
LREVHECMAVRAEVLAGFGDGNRKVVEEDVRERFGQSGFLDWSWACP